MIDYTAGHRYDYLCGWRYLFSPAFRSRMRARWGAQAWQRALMYAGLTLSMLVSTGVAVLAFMALVHLLKS